MPSKTMSEGRRTMAARLRAGREVEEAARAALANHGHFRGRADQFVLTVVEEVLVVRGAVPSFYLKQTLQSVLKTVEGVQRIHNQVVVFNPLGLSTLSTRLQRQDEDHRRSTHRCQKPQI